MFLAALSEFRDCERFRFHSRESAGCLLVEFVATVIYVLFGGGGEYEVTWVGKLNMS